MQKLREAKIFLSSSFQDMHEERDYLLGDVFPLLELVLRCYYIRLRVVDLRGSAQQCEQEAFEREVFRMCLDEMDACKPRMIGLIGNRYGWVPYRMGQSDAMMEGIVKKLAAEHGLSLYDVSDKSITHLEILYGLNIMNLQLCYFYFREIANKDALTPEDRKRYLSGDQAGLEKLKAELQKAYSAQIAPEGQTGAHLIRYNAVIRHGVDENMKKLGAMIRGDITNSFIREGVLEGQRDPVWYIRLINYWDDMQDHTVPHALLPSLLAFSAPVLRVTGVEGIGKSVLLAQYLYAQPEDVLTLTLVCGLEPDTETADEVAAYLLRQLCFLTGRKAQAKGADEFLRLLDGYCAAGRHVVVAIDGLERMKRAQWQACAAWLERLPKNARLVLAASEGFFSQSEEAFTLQAPCDTETLLAMLSARQGKKLDAEVLNLLLASADRDGANPLRLSLLVRHLLTMRREEYEMYRGFDAHLQWMRHVLESPEARTVEGCAALVIRRAVASSEPGIVESALLALRKSKTTIGEGTLFELFGQAQIGVPKPRGLKALFGGKAYIAEQRQQFIRLQARLRPLLLFDSYSQNWALGHASFLKSVDTGA